MLAEATERARAGSEPPMPTDKVAPVAARVCGTDDDTEDAVEANACGLTNQGNRRPGAQAKPRTRGVRVDRDVRPHDKSKRQAVAVRHGANNSAAIQRWQSRRWMRHQDQRWRRLAGAPCDERCVLPAAADVNRR